ASVQGFGAGDLAIELHGARAVGAAPAPVPPRLRLFAPRAGGAPALAELLPGDRLRARLRIRRLEARANPGGPDREREAARRGIGASAALVHPALVVRRPDAERWPPLAPV